MALEPISTSNIISIAQIGVVIVGFFFTYKSIMIAAASLKTASDSLKLSTANAQAQLFNQMVIQGRDLQYKFMDIYFVGDTDEDKESRKKIYMGSLISYYSACFALRSVLALPQSVVKMLDEDLREVMRQEPFRKHWESVAHLHSADFVNYVNSIKGIRL